MQYKVPQNVDIEDRVIGPFSLRQFLIILIGCGVVLFLNFILVGILRPLFFLLAITILAGCVGVAMAKYGSQNFEDFLAAAITTFSRPFARVWKKTEDIPQVVKAPTPQKKNLPEKPAAKKSLEDARSDLEKLAELVDSGGYSGLEKKGYLENLPESQEITELEAQDLLEKSKESQAGLDKILEGAKNLAPKREPLVSEAAKVSPAKKFDYPQVQLSSQRVGTEEPLVSRVVE